MKKVRKFKIKFVEILVLVLFIVVVSFLAINIKNLLKSEGIKNITEAKTSLTNVISGSASSGEHDKLKVTGNAIAVLDIPSRNIRGQVVNGIDDETLKDYIGRFESSAEPGQIGNFCVAAHNNIYTELFANLHNVQIGDRVRIVTKDMEYVYRVTSKEKVTPDRTDVLEGSNKREITMITCSDFATKRWVVKGELVSEINVEE